MRESIFWITLLVILQTAFVSCRDSSYEFSSQAQDSDGIKNKDIAMSSGTRRGTSVTANIFIGAGAVILFVILFCCICYQCSSRCGKQSLYSGIILGQNRVQTVNVQIDQPVVIQHSRPLPEENNRQMPRQNQPVLQQQYPPMQPFPPHYQPVQQFPSHNHPMQQFPPDNQPMKQFSTQHSPMRQFSPQNSPMQQFPPQNQPMQQQFPPQNQPMQQQFLPQDQLMQQFPSQYSPLQQPATTSQFQISPGSENFAYFPEPPPAYENNLPPKY